MLSFSFSNRSQIYFLLFLELRDEWKVSQRNLHCFPNTRSVTLKDRDTVNITANLSTWRHLTNQSMIPESGIMERRHQGHVYRFCRPFPIPRPPLGSLRSPLADIFSHLTPFFALFPSCGAWSQANVGGSNGWTQDIFTFGYPPLTTATSFKFQIVSFLRPGHHWDCVQPLLKPTLPTATQFTLLLSRPPIPDILRVSSLAPREVLRYSYL